MLVDKLYAAAICVIAIMLIVVLWRCGAFAGEQFGEYISRWSYSWQDWEDPKWSDQHELAVIGGPPSTAECRRDKAGPDSIYLNLSDDAIAEAAADPEVRVARIKMEPRKATPLLRASIPSEINYVEHLGACPADLIQTENALKGRAGPIYKPASAILRAGDAKSSHVRDTSSALSAPPTLKIDGMLDPVIIGDNGYVFKV